jgi:hypothetical protein
MLWNINVWQHSVVSIDGVYLDDTFQSDSRGVEMYLYVIAGEPKVVKIGISMRPHRRLKSLQAGYPYRLRIAALWHCADLREAQRREQDAHDLFAADRIMGEWFSVRVGEAVQVIRNMVQQPPIQLRKPDWVPAIELVEQPRKVEVGAAECTDAIAADRRFATLIVCPACRHKALVKINPQTAWNSKFRCGNCNKLSPGRRVWTGKQPRREPDKTSQIRTKP